MFKSRRFPAEIILLYVRWYCKYYPLKENGGALVAVTPNPQKEELTEQKQLVTHRPLGFKMYI